MRFWQASCPAKPASWTHPQLFIDKWYESNYMYVFLAVIWFRVIIKPLRSFILCMRRGKVYALVAFDFFGHPINNCFMITIWLC